MFNSNLLIVYYIIIVIRIFRIISPNIFIIIYSLTSSVHDPHFTVSQCEFAKNRIKA